MRSLVVLALALAPTLAHADIFTIWAAGKADYVTGSGDVYKRFDAPFGYGAEAGIEVLYIDLWGEALIMGTDQYLFTVNAGFDFAFGEDTRFSLGLFTGPMFFGFPEQEVQTVQASRLQAAGLPAETANKVADEYNKRAQEEQDLSRLAVGWNLVRLQANLEFKLASILYLGVGAEGGYHFLLSGEEAAGDAKAQALDNAIAKIDDVELTNEQERKLRDELGAEEVDTDNLDGFNIQVGAYLKLEF